MPTPTSPPKNPSNPPSATPPSTTTISDNLFQDSIKDAKSSESVDVTRNDSPSGDASQKSPVNAPITKKTTPVRRRFSMLPQKENEPQEAPETQKIIITDVMSDEETHEAPNGTPREAAKSTPRKERTPKAESASRTAVKPKRADAAASALVLQETAPPASSQEGRTPSQTKTIRKTRRKKPTKEDAAATAPDSTKETIAKAPASSKNTTSTITDAVPPPEQNDDDKEGGEESTYAVERVLAEGVSPDGEPLYFIKWAGWSITTSTWEPVENLANSQDKIKEYQAFPAKVKAMQRVPPNATFKKERNWKVEAIREKRKINPSIPSDGSKYEYLVEVREVGIKFWEPESFIDEESESCKKRATKRKKTGTTLYFARAKLKEFRKRQEAKKSSKKEPEADADDDIQDEGSDADPYGEVQIVDKEEASWPEDFEDEEEEQITKRGSKRKRKATARTAGPPAKRKRVPPAKKLLDTYHLHTLKIEGVQRIGPVSDWIVRYRVTHDDHLKDKVFSHPLGELRHSHPQDIISLFENIAGLSDVEKDSKTTRKTKVTTRKSRNKSPRAVADSDSEELWCRTG